MQFHRLLLRAPAHHPIKVVPANHQNLPRLLSSSSTRTPRPFSVLPSAPPSRSFVAVTAPLQSQRFFQSSSAKMVREIGSHDEFKNVIDADKLVVLDCYATWCGPCRLIAPKIVAFSQDYPEVDFYKVDVDEVSSVASELGVRAMPTFFFFRKGEKIAEVVGANPAAIKAAIEKHK